MIASVPDETFQLAQTTRAFHNLPENSALGDHRSPASALATPLANFATNLPSAVNLPSGTATRTADVWACRARRCLM